MGLLDNFFGGGDPNQSLYGDALTPEQLAALRQRGLLGFLGGMQKSGALDSTIPTLTGKMPGSFASGLAAGAGGMGEAMDAGALNAMRSQQLGLQTQQLRSQLSMRDKLMGALPGLLGGGEQGAQPGAVPAAAPQQASPDPALDTAVPGDNWEVAHNNFGGLRIPGSTVGPKAGGFQAFASPEDGVAAISRQLDRYASGATTGTPLTTIRQIVSTWAPPSENPTTTLVDRASKVVGADPDKPLDLSDPAIKAKLIEATIRNEQGGKLPIDPALIVKVAQAGPGAPAMTVGGGLLGGSSSPSATPAAPSGLLPPAPSGGMMPGGAAQPSPTLTNGINPRNLAAAGVMAQLSGIGDAFKPIENYYYNSPGQKGAVASAEKWAGVAPDLYTKWKSPMDVRANGMIIDPSTGRVVARNPSVPLGYTVGQGPNGPVAEEVPGAIPGIARSEAAKVTGANQANLGMGQQLPGATADQSAQGATAGTPLAKGLSSTIPNYQEPLLSADELKSRIPEWTKAGRDMTASIGMAQQAEHRLSNIGDALKLTEAGAFSTHKAELSAALKALGMPSTAAAISDPAAVQLALHENYRSTLQNLAAVNKRFSQMEFRITSENSEHPNLQPEANLNMLSEDIGTLRQMQGMGHDWLTAQNAGKHNLDAFETAWLKANPLSKISDAVKQEIGPLKGMPGTATAKDGDIVTNPKTGQRLQNRGGQWLDLQTLKPYSP